MAQAGARRNSGTAGNTSTARGVEVLSAVGEGSRSPGHAAQFVTAIGTLARVVEVDELTARVALLEALVASLRRRIEALEARTPRCDVVTIVSFFAAGAEAAEPTGFRTIDGAQRWEREPGETADPHLERASREVQRNEKGLAVVIEESVGGDFTA